MKMFAKYLKVLAKKAPNFVWFWKIGAQHVQNHMKPFLWGLSQNKVFTILVGGNVSHEELPEKFSGQFGEIQAKTFRTTQIFACSYTHSDEGWFQPIAIIITAQ